MDARVWQRKAADAFRSGDLATAHEALTRAAALDPVEPEYVRNLAELAREQGDHEKAVHLLDRAEALTREAPSIDRLNYLAASWGDLGERQRQLDAAAQALSLQDNPTSRAVAADALRRMIHLRPDQRPLLVRALNEAWLGDELHRPASAILHNEWPAKAEDLAQDALLAAYLAVGPLKDSVLEVRLTAVRRELLLRPLTNALAPLLLRIASQCFINEYAWGVSAEEAAEVQRLRDAPITGESLAKLAAYLPLYSLDGAEQLLDREWPAPLQALLRQQVAEPFKERQIATAIPALTAITAGVSEVVREMYEENPYPRWSRATPPRPPSACAGDPVAVPPGAD